MGSHPAFWTGPGSRPPSRASTAESRTIHQYLPSQGHAPQLNTEPTAAASLSGVTSASVAPSEAISHSGRYLRQETTAQRMPGGTRAPPSETIYRPPPEGYKNWDEAQRNWGWGSELGRETNFSPIPSGSAESTTSAKRRKIRKRMPAETEISDGVARNHGGAQGGVSDGRLGGRQSFKKDDRSNGKSRHRSTEYDSTESEYDGARTTRPSSSQETHEPMKGPSRSRESSRYSGSKSRSSHDSYTDSGFSRRSSRRESIKQPYAPGLTPVPEARGERGSRAPGNSYGTPSYFDSESSVPTVPPSRSSHSQGPERTPNVEARNRDGGKTSDSRHGKKNGSVANSDAEARRFLDDLLSGP